MMLSKSVADKLNLFPVFPLSLFFNAHAKQKKVSTRCESECGLVSECELLLVTRRAQTWCGR